MRVEDKYLYCDERSKIIEKDWAAGSSEPIEHTEFIYNTDGTMTKEQLIYPPSLYKVIDEPIVNALDHLVNCSPLNPRREEFATYNKTGRVTRIDITIDETTGRCTIMNDGPGIESDIHTKVGIPTPQFIFGVLFQGGNTKKAEDSITGGTNGVGSKVANCFSSMFMVETVAKGLKYVQRWIGGPDGVEPPTITPYKGAEYTTLTFDPDFTGIYKYKSRDEIVPTFVKLGRTRALYAAMYASSIDPRTRVTFNGAVMPAGLRPGDIARMLFGDEPIINVTCAKWQYAVVVAPLCDGRSSHGRGALANVNGIVTVGGSHISHIVKKLIHPAFVKYASKALGDKKAAVTAAAVSNNIFIVGNMQIPKPGWSSQRKDVLTLDGDKHFTGQTIPQSQLDEISAALLPILFKPKKATKKRERLDNIDKYRPAEKSGTARYSALCSLILCEGDSAMSQVITGMATSAGFEYYGVMSTGGVIINARNEVRYVGKHLRPTTKLTNNIFMSNFVKVMGLDWNAKYDPASASYAEEMARLRYGCVVACVDQDLDGVGNIFGLILNNFEVLWPNLLKAGFVKRFATPIIRAYPSSSKGNTRVLDFYTDVEYRKWVSSLPSNGEDAFEIKYYKGIGTHSREETVSMFKYFKDRLYTYQCGDASERIFLSYYDTNRADERKAILSVPVDPPTDAKVAEQESTRLVKCEDHLQYETKMYQLDNIERHLLHVIDGHNQSGRKIYDGSLKAFASSNKRMKVAQLAGYIAEHENYHHGEASLGDSVRAKAMTFLGAEQVPYLVPLSSFGTRMHGGKDAGSTRYIFTKFNKRVWDVMCPPEDYQLLEFNFDEGERSEPRYFVPIIPTVLLANCATLGHGWNITLWAREVMDVIDNVIGMVKCGSGSLAFASLLSPCTYGFKGHIEYPPASVGCLNIIDHNTVRITELPLRVWTDPYVKKLAAIEGVDRVTDKSNDKDVDIIVKLKPGIVESLGEDGLIGMLKLRKSMKSNINLIMPGGEVRSFNIYEEIFPVWFPVRQEQYSKRIDHKRELLEIRIDIALSKLRYSREYDTLIGSNNKKKKDVAEMEAALKGAGYARVNKSHFNSLKFVPTASLRGYVFREGNTNYNYLIDDVSDRMKSADGITRQEAALEALKAELAALNAKAALGRFPGAAIWLEELETLKSAIEEGRRTNWLYGENNKYVLS